MAEGAVHSRYVKLTKDQGPVEEIKPGELNQPIDVPQLNVHKCNECGQPLPESYEPPANEPWTTGIFGCAEDTESCWTGLFCPCVLFGRNIERLREDTPWTTPCICHAICIEGGIALAIGTGVFHGIDPRTSFLICEGLLFAWWMCGIYTGLVRQSLQKKYHLQNSPCDPCMVHCCMHWCALCQEHREIKGRLSEDLVMPMTIVNPPPVQEMNSEENNQQDAAPASAKAIQIDTSSQLLFFFLFNGETRVRGLRRKKTETGEERSPCQGAASTPAHVKLAAVAVDLNVRLRSADMSAAMQERAFRYARSLLDAHSDNVPTPTHLAMRLKKEFDALYGPAWHCIVGKSFGSFVTHSSGGFVYFSIDKLSFLLFKTEVRPIIKSPS
ncbi:hypothetical protein AAG906_035507 [Vitis piasezkii]